MNYVYNTPGQRGINYKITDKSKVVTSPAADVETFDGFFIIHTDIYIKKQDLSLSLYYKHYICDTDSNLKNKVILLFAAVILIVIATVIKIYFT
jgi:hypothetical protein